MKESSISKRAAIFHAPRESCHRGTETRRKTTSGESGEAFICSSPLCVSAPLWPSLACDTSPQESILQTAIYRNYVARRFRQPAGQQQKDRFSLIVWFNGCLRQRAFGVEGRQALAQFIIGRSLAK